ncbi:MAG: hypothetical protein A3J10_01940 [Candidatus Sungbacteria bacterium RIFCSPLOWO2_02_FULL_54_10]|uniref:Glycosyltransferase subfamily 4-like N-terminal domain-containing protein n=1 Tax=Candidatus Sungbacteria bacterium RIFCSPHIGHO2_02_FULL_53_17 TaxID=1802275 RepID=A0A1G2KUT3_9BACT|nr:MAG: hypothetical protein A2679_03270 [Candidatus Sungbacteria bacterium RIFCSPHIGHO2_01_FULL_54_26]OHA03166.1 MAG: hypothetical protein A3C92_03845 [Candidatus Sungbacteria bacterium RIFCSPHIGHO2_02_FULL_53_17]OHA12782.1 MAG: hypothetical protein A3J10_01940 [Candidatus Sungbacteria bacterium RIFCSPLOWO2_02_FULL_54_10]
MKTIGIAIFEGVASKNILRTQILPALLARPDVQVALVAKSRERVAYHEKEFNDARISYTVIEPHRPKGLDAFFARLKFFLLRTETTVMRQRATAPSPLHFFLWSLLNQALARPTVQKIVRWGDYALVRPLSYAVYFEKHRPDIIVAANLFDEAEAQLVREARLRGIPTIGFVNSWDKTTARSGIRIFPDHFIVFNEQVRDELVRYHGADPAKIFVGGIPQYDQYMIRTPSPRDVFFKSIGIDPHMKLVVYSPLGGTFWSGDWAMIDFLQKIVSEGRLGVNVALLVRFPPNEFVNEKELASRPWLYYDYPGMRFSTARGSDWDMTFPELDHLSDTLTYMSLLICYASSISVDAAILDRPVINIHFTLDESVRFGGFTVEQLYRLTHYRAALASGGIRLVENADALAAQARAYLEHPVQDRKGRARLAREQCAYLDGKSGERIGNFILNYL